jgi:hypothetical protein
VELSAIKDWGIKDQGTVNVKSMTSILSPQFQRIHIPPFAFPLVFGELCGKPRLDITLSILKNRQKNIWIYRIR